MGLKANIAFVAVGLLALATPAVSEPATVTVEQVLANPIPYQDKPVRVRGFATFEFENNRLWRDEVAYRTYERDQALYIDTEGLTQSRRDEAKGRLAYVTGTLKPRYDSLVLTEVMSVQRDPTDHGPDRGWWSDPEFGTLFLVLGALGFVAVSLALSLRAQRLALQPGWKPTKPKI